MESRRQQEVAQILELTADGGNMLANISIPEVGRTVEEWLVVLPYSTNPTGSSPSVWTSLPVWSLQFESEKS